MGSDVGAYQTHQRRSSHLDELPYGSALRNPQVVMRGQMNCNVSQYNLSDQKTPNRHPNSFLYKAHINLNEGEKTGGDNKHQPHDQLDIDQLAHHFRDQQNDISEFVAQSDGLENAMNDLQNAITCARPKIRQDLNDSNQIDEQNGLRMKISG